MEDSEIIFRADGRIAKRQHPHNERLFWCSACRQFKDVDAFFYDEHTSQGVAAYCAKCAVSKTVEHQRTHRDALRKRRKKYRMTEKGKNHELENGRRWHRKHRMEIREKDTKVRSGLEEQYVKRTLIQTTELKYDEIPIEIIELKRKQLQTHRVIKKLKEELKEKEG